MLVGLGEIPMKPEFGLRVHEYLFKGITSFQRSKLAHEVRAFIEEFEPRVRVLSVIVDGGLTAGGEPDSGLFVTVRYEADGQEEIFGIPLQGGE